MAERLDEDALDTLFREARTHRAWFERPISDDTLRELHELLKFGPTAGNCCPARFVFIKSKEAKERLRPALDEGNVTKTMTAPVTVIIAYDLEFYEKLVKLAPGRDARAGYVGQDDLIRETAFRSGTLQGAYLILAARALGLDCGPMSGFDNEMVDREFFPGGRVKSNFLCNLGCGDPARLRPRAPRLDFEEACRIL